MTISSLTVVEMRSLLARRRRLGEIDADTERRAFSLFQQHVEARFLALEAVKGEHVLTAARMLDSIPGCALRTIDAIHLSICQALDPVQLATADAVMATAARELGIEVVRSS
ncbi:MAG: type II toxin-antitoxin system VapC family toxin [Acidobacteriota bacterium]